MNISQKLNKCKSIFLFIFSILSFILTFYSYEIADRLNLDRIKVISTYVLKQTILLENLFSGVLNYSLFDVSSLDDKEIVEKINDLTIVSIHSPEDIKSKMPTLFKICKTLLERTEFETLKKNKPLSISAWLYYAPCNINEGPIFIKNCEKSRIEILKEINSIEQMEIRNKLSDYFKIKSIKDI